MPPPRYHIAVYGEPHAAAAVRIHGSFPTVAAARAAVTALAQEQEDVQSRVRCLGRWRAPLPRRYILDSFGRFLPVVNTMQRDSRFVGAAEEIAARENEDSAAGRMGSVCDVRRQGGQGGAAAPFEETGASAAATPPPVVKQREVGRQRAQLEDLLAAPVDPPPETAESYAALRGRYATLRAFERKLARLVEEAEAKSEGSLRLIAALDAEHPTHRSAFRDHYYGALRESGMRPDSVPFVPFLALPGEDAVTDC